MLLSKNKVQKVNNFLVEMSNVMAGNSNLCLSQRVILSITTYKFFCFDDKIIIYLILNAYSKYKL